MVIGEQGRQGHCSRASRELAQFKSRQRILPHRAFDAPSRGIRFQSGGGLSETRQVAVYETGIAARIGIHELELDDVAALIELDCDRVGPAEA